MNNQQRRILSLLITGALLSPMMGFADSTDTNGGSMSGANNSQLNSTANPDNGSANGTKVPSGQTKSNPKKKHKHHRKSSTSNGSSASDTSGSSSDQTTQPANR